MDVNQVRSAYDAASHQYFERFRNELDYKPFDRELLIKFVAEARQDGLLLDVGCGPGHVTEFLRCAGGRAIGIDLSSIMIEEASRQFPECHFQTADIRDLPFEDCSIDGIVAFYSIVHFAAEELVDVFRELARVLKPDARLLLSFHAGTEDIIVDDFLQSGKPLRFWFLDPDTVQHSLTSSGFTIVSPTIRDAYPEEHPTKRCYITASKSRNVFRAPQGASRGL